MLFTNQQSLHNQITDYRSNGFSIGFVPTMGALHLGHISLMQQAARDNDIIVISIFINPTQFDNPIDLDNYPNHLQRDLDLINNHIGDHQIIVYAPSVNDIYGDNPKSKSYAFNGLDQVMEGANRPGHFDGVGTIIEFFFTLINPDRAYFGQKDYQQLLIVKQLTKQLKLPIQIIGCPIKREDNGLAMSSRNERLSDIARRQAAFIYNSLIIAQSYFISHDIQPTIKLVEQLFDQHQYITLEYITIADDQTLVPAHLKRDDTNYRAFIVAHIDGVRLIDNIPLT